MPSRTCVIVAALAVGSIISAQGAFGVSMMYDAYGDHTLTQDADGDSDVDLADFGIFQDCFNGPNRSWLPTADAAKCSCLDANGDMDVDLNDYGVFQACFNGPNRPAPQPLCDSMNAVGH